MATSAWQSARGAAEKLAGVRLVIDDEHPEAREGTILAHIVDRTALLGAHLHARSGWSGWTTVMGKCRERESRSLALPGAHWPVMLPPCISTRCLAMASPSS